MKKPFSLRQLIRNFLLLLLLFFLILAPRPLSGELYLARAGRYNETGNFAQAATAYTSAAQRIPWNPSLWEKAGDAYLQAEDFNRSDNAYLQALRHHSLSINGTMHWGDAAFARGDTRLCG